MRGNRKAFCVWLAAVSPIGAAIPSAAAAEDVRPLTSQLLPDEPGKALTAVLVTLGPGESAAPHRHGAAFVYAYVLKGRVRSQLEGSPARDYSVGESWTEPPGAHHVVTQNLNKTSPTELLVIFIAPQGARLKVDD
jgi:quercetin dioxygenase-like cupin family protein